MSDTRHANTNWEIKGPLDWPGAQLAVLMDIRDELQKLNRLLHCRNFTEMPMTLRLIDRRLGIRWAKKRKPRAKR